MEENKKLKNFLSATALVIDDEIVDEKSTISQIISDMEKYGTLFIKRRDLLDSIDSISNIAFIVLDWDLTKQEDKMELPEGVSLGATLQQDNKNKLRTFIKEVISRYFIPIFLFTREDIGLIRAYLEEQDLIKEAINKNRIFLRNKSSLQKENVIISLNDWLNNSVTVYTYKIMEEAIDEAKHRFFNEMYACDLNWPCHVYQTLKQDNPADINSDFQDFLITAYTSTIDPLVFEAEGFNKEIDLTEEEILKIYSKIKFLSYKDNCNIGPHPGDIYKLEDGDETEFFVNISASCDMRNDKHYFVKGKVSENPQEKICLYIVKKFMNRQAVCFDFRKTIITKTSSDNNTLTEGNGKDAKKYKRIGRLLSPYINALQEKYSYYITRTGVLREPN